MALYIHSCTAVIVIGFRTFYSYLLTPSKAVRPLSVTPIQCSSSDNGLNVNRPLQAHGFELLVPAGDPSLAAVVLLGAGALVGKVGHGR